MLQMKHEATGKEWVDPQKIGGAFKRQWISNLQLPFEYAWALISVFGYYTEFTQRINTIFFFFQKNHLEGSTFWRRSSWVLGSVVKPQTWETRPMGSLKTSDIPIRSLETEDTEPWDFCPFFSQSDQIISLRCSVNSPPQGASIPPQWVLCFFKSTSASGTNPTIKIMCFSEDLILNCHARWTSQITADPLFPRQ